jgi:hypothetical protein
VLFQDLRQRLHALPRPKWFSSSLSNISFDKVNAVTFIQKIFRLNSPPSLSDDSLSRSPLLRRGHRARRRFQHLKDSILNQTEEEIKSEKLRQDWKDLQKQEQEAHLAAMKLEPSPPTTDSDSDSKPVIPIPPLPIDPHPRVEAESSKDEPNELQETEELGKDGDDLIAPNNSPELEPTPPSSAQVDEPLVDPTASPLPPLEQDEEPTVVPALAPDETPLEVKEVMEGMLDTLEMMNHRKSVPQTPNSPSTPSPLHSSRTRDTTVTDYTMVSEQEEENDDPIDVEKLKQEMRSAYLKEWGDMRGMVFENDEEAELAFQTAKNRQPEKVSNSAPPEPEEEPKPPTPSVEKETEPMSDPQPEIVSGPLTPATLPAVPILDTNLLTDEAKDLVTPLPSSRSTARPPTNKSRSSSSKSKRRQSSLFLPPPPSSSTEAGGGGGGGGEGHDSDEENFKQKNKFRQNFPPSELEALLGFFPELRCEISELLRQKRHLKLDISEWKAEFFVQNGREANWSERKEAIGELYERYHQVGYRANKVLKELMEAEDDLLRGWEARREKLSKRKK